MNTIDVDLSNNPLKAQNVFLILWGGCDESEEETVGHGTRESEGGGGWIVSLLDM